MKEGLLWFDNNPQRQLAEKINRAAHRYKARFGRRPTLCYLNTADFDDKMEETNGVRLRVMTNVLRHHFWIGVDGRPIKAKAV